MVAFSGFLVPAVAIAAVMAALVRPVLTQEQMCPESYHLEQHVGYPKSGNVCRADGADKGFVCPRCCKTTRGPPYCESTTVVNEPCRATDLSTCTAAVAGKSGTIQEVERERPIAGKPGAIQEVERERPGALRWPELHGASLPLTRQYKKYWGQFMRNDDPVTIVTLTGECEFAILKPEAKRSPATLARNQSRTLGLANGPEWTTREGRGKLREVQVTGKVAGWNGWFQGDYGYTIYDHLPGLAWLFQNTGGRLLVLETPATKEIVRCVFGPEQSKRVVWIQEDVLIRITGSLTVISAPKSYSGRRGSRRYLPARFSPPLRQALQLQLARSTTCKSSTQRGRTVIYYSRNSKKTNHGRTSTMDKQNEGLVASEIREGMKKWGIPGDVIIFNGMRKDGTPLSIEDQIRLFSSARIVIGPHGSGLANIAWMDWSGNSDPQVLEFICTSQSTAVQGGCPWSRTHYALFAAPRPLSYHHIGFTSQSTAKTTYVNIDSVRQALDVMMSTYPKTLRFMQPLDVADPDGIPFFWHVPKAAGSYARMVFHLGYTLEPRASVGLPFQLDMFTQRMKKHPPTLNDTKFATGKCDLIRTAREKTGKEKWTSTRFNACVAKLSVSQPEHLCLPDCLGFVQTPLLHGAAAIFERTSHNARVATILREPISRFMSKFTYLKTATWEATYNPTRETVDGYVQKGIFEKSWMVKTLSNCNSPVTTDADLEVAKQVLSRMLVGFTDNMAEFFDRVEVYWNIPQRSRELARNGPMKKKVNVNTKANVTRSKADTPSNATLAILRHELRHDIALFNYAKDVLWGLQGMTANMAQKSTMSASEGVVYKTAPAVQTAATALALPPLSPPVEAGAVVQNRNAKRIKAWDVLEMDHALKCEPSFQLHHSNATEQVQYRAGMRKTVRKFSRGKPPAATVIELAQGSYVIRQVKPPAASHSAWNAVGAVQGPFWHPPDPNMTAGGVLKGDWAAFNHWQSAFAHFLVDHLPIIARLRAVLPPNTKFVLRDHPIFREVLAEIDPTFARNVHWLQPGSIITVTGKLYVLKEAGIPALRHQLLVNTLSEWVASTMPNAPGLEKNIVYQTRAPPTGGTDVALDARHGRIIDAAHEAYIIALVREAMVRHKRTERLVIFSGRDENGKPMTGAAQMALYRSASVVIGPHGGAMANIVWMMGSRISSCNSRVAVLEFLCGPRSAAVQKGCPYGKTFFNLYATAPWVDYHHVMYAPNSTSKTTFIHTNDFRIALDSIFDSSRAD